MSDDIYQVIVDFRKKGVKAALATIVDKSGSAPLPPGFKCLVLETGKVIGTIGGGIIESKVVTIAKDVIRDKQPRLLSYDLSGMNVKGATPLCGGSIKVFVEPISNTDSVIVFGAGHIGKILAKILNLVDFRVIVIDDRKDYANQKNFPTADRIIVSESKKAFGKIVVDDSTFIIITTRGHTIDREIIEWALSTSAKYIGMIGSTRKFDLFSEDLLKKGITKKQLAKVHTPIGLEIHAKTPAEIAVSIVAEMVKIRNKP